jgi:hypothetical protein
MIIKKYFIIFFKDTEDLDGDLFKGMGKTSLSKTLPSSSFSTQKPSIMKKLKSKF